MNTRKFRILIRSLLCVLVIGAVPATSFGAVFVGVSINVAPPALPAYVQPPCPVPGYLWTPGYWAYGPYGYYWVPGVWVRPPVVGVYWTPGYWGYVGGFYRWNAGYWGPRVGYYGGVNYGFGYTGIGFVGGVWAGNVYRYNTAVVNVNRTVIHNTYIDRTVIHNTTVINRASFNGPGGVQATPTAYEHEAMHEHHYQPTAEQVAHRNTADRNPAQRYSANHGAPHTFAMNRVNGRQFNQQGRIATPERSSQLTPNQTRNSARREDNVNHTVHRERQANGGAPARYERQPVNQRQMQHERQPANRRQQNHPSHPNQRDKHNDRDERH